MKRWLVLATLGALGCEWPVLSLAERTFLDGAIGSDADRDQDEDDGGDEDIVPCNAALPCNDSERSMCDLARGFCVECLRDEDCDNGEGCAADGECDD